VRAFIMALKYSRSPLILEKLPQIVGLFNGAGEVRLQYLDFVIRYLEYFVPKEMHNGFSRIIHRGDELGDDAMKKKSILWELGFDNGLEEGEDKVSKKAKK
jgi:hypothetical protein